MLLIEQLKFSYPSEPGTGMHFDLRVEDSWIEFSFARQGASDTLPTVYRMAGLRT